MDRWGFEPRGAHDHEERQNCVGEKAASLMLGKIGKLANLSEGIRSFPTRNQALPVPATKWTTSEMIANTSSR